MVRVRVSVWIYTLPKTNSLHLKIGPSKRKIIFQHQFSGAKMLVSGRVPTIKTRNEHLGPAGFPNRSSRPGWKHVSPCGDWIHGLSRLEKQRDSLLKWGNFGLREGLPNFVTRNGWHKISDIGGSSHSIVFEADSMLFVTSHVSIESFIDQFLHPTLQPNQLASFPQKLCKDTVAIALYPKKLLAHSAVSQRSPKRLSRQPSYLFGNTWNKPDLVCKKAWKPSWYLPSLKLT